MGVSGRRDLPDDPFTGEEEGGSGGSTELTNRLSDGLNEAVARAVAFCRAAGAGREEAEDCVQDAVVAMLTSRSGGAAVRRPEAWLAVVARRRLVDRIRRTRAEQAALSQGLMWAAHAELEQDVAEQVADRDLARWQAAALTNLPPVTQQVCQATSAGLSTGQVAEQMGISRRSVESHLTRARAFLRSLAHGSGLVVICAVVRRLVRHRPWVEAADTIPDSIRLVTASALAVTVGVASQPPAAPRRPHFPQPRPPAAAGSLRRPAPGHDQHGGIMGGSHTGTLVISHPRVSGSTGTRHTSDTATTSLTATLSRNLPSLSTASPATSKLRHPTVPAPLTVTKAPVHLPDVTRAADAVTGLAGTPG